MEIPEEYKEYKELYKLCFENKKILEKAKKCVCFYCGHRFTYGRIKEWINDRNDYTAQCPKCQIDSVIPATVNGYEVTDKDIEILNKYYF